MLARACWPPSPSSRTPRPCIRCLWVAMLRPSTFWDQEVCMFRKLMAGFIALLWSVMALAPVEANKANEAELTSINGIGPAISARILEQRKSSASRDGPHFIAPLKARAEPTASNFYGDV